MPREEQLAHMLERTLIEDAENKEAAFNFFPLECSNTYTFMLTTIPNRIAVIVEKIKPIIASSGK
jgi:hypothetical protein